MQRSAYFDDLDSGVGSESRVRSFDSQAQSSSSRELAAYTQNKPTQFPISRRILWDREPTDAPRFIRSVDAIPPLHITAKSIKALLNDVSKGNFDKPAKIVALNDLPEQDRASLTLSSPMRSVLGASSFVVQIAEGSYNTSSSGIDTKVTIPVSARPLSDTALAFDSTATSNMIANMTKILKTGRECSLKSCLRLRAAGQVSTDADGQTGQFRFEAVVPDVSFQAVRIRPLPLLATPLSLTLTRRGTAAGNANAGPTMGYLTLNQTRKVVPLLATDPALAMAPIVGVWTVLDSDNDGLDSGNELYLKHPFLWAACTWFLHNSKVADKAFISEGTFLLANFGATSATYYEMTRLGGDNAGNPDYLCCDFTVDLHVDEGCEATDPVLCKFRPLSQESLIDSFRSAGGSHRARGYTSSNDKQTEIALSEVQLLAASARIAQAHKTQMQEALSLQSLNSEMDTPLPRDGSAIPAPSPGKEVNEKKHPPVEASAFNSQLHGIRDSQTSILSDNSTNTGGGKAGGKAGNAGSSSALIAATYPHPQYPASYPAEVIMSQQMQLDALREQVQVLSDIIRKMGGAIPALPAVPVMASVDDTNVARAVSSDNAPAAAPAPAGTSIYGNIPPRAGRASPSTIPIATAKTATAADEGVPERSEDRPMKLIRAESPIIGQQNQALSLGRSAHETLPTSSTHRKHHNHHDHHHKYDTKNPTAGAAVPPVAPARSSYSRVNPLDSASANHPVLRLAGTDESELMEPSIMNQHKYGTASFPGPSLDEDVASTGEYVDDYNSDEERLNSIRAYHKEKYEDLRVSVSSNDSVSSRGDSNSSFRSSREADVLGSLNRSLNSRASEGPSTLETDSILAIEARYR